MILPAVAESVIGYTPLVTVEILKVINELHGGAQEAGLKFTVTPLGCPEALRTTLSLVPESCSKFSVVSTFSLVAAEPSLEVSAME